MHPGPGSCQCANEDFEPWLGTSWSVDWVSPWGGSLGEKLGEVLGTVTCKQVSWFQHDPEAEKQAC